MKLARPSWLRRSTILACLAGAILVVVATGVLTANSAPHALKPARPFALTAVTGGAGDVALSHYDGRPVIINFFASWCTPCRKETPLLGSFYRSQHGRVLVIGIDANDQRGAARAFLHKYGVSYPVAFDPTATVTVSYGVVALPQTFFLNARHQIVRHVVGALTGRDLTSWAASLPHGNEAS
jgi:cytochrome c biogenesis protein CcmG, thiol:disulfide interchange protein DsbE